MKAVRVAITPELFCQAMRLPEGTKLRHISLNGPWIEAVFEHADLPDSPSPVPSARPTFQRSTTRTEAAIDFTGWNIEQ